MKWNFNLDECPEWEQVLLFQEVNVNGTDTGENLLGFKVGDRFYQTSVLNSFYTMNDGGVIYSDASFENIDDFQEYEVDNINAFCIIPQIEKKD